MASDFRQKADEAAQMLRKDYQIEDSAGLLLLELYAGTLATELEALASIEKFGMMVPDRFKQPKPHPLLQSLRDARAQRLQVLKALGLDFVEENHRGPGRPPGRAV
jgi:phage terminase small subunit